MTVEDTSADTVAAEKFVQQLQHLRKVVIHLNKFQYRTDCSVLEKDGFRDLHLLRGKISTCI